MNKAESLLISWEGVVWGCRKTGIPKDGRMAEASSDSRAKEGPAKSYTERLGL
jgi:hypothetical protein